MPPIFWMSSVASSRTTSTMSSTVTMPFITPVAVDDGQRREVMRSNSSPTASWSMSSCTVTSSVVHDLVDASGPAAPAKSSRNDTTPSSLLLVVEHVGVDRATRVLARLATQVGDRLVDRHVGAHARVARVHQTAGIVLGVGEERGHVAAGRLVEEAQQIGPFLARSLLDHVGGVVRGEQAEPRAALDGRQLEEELRLVARRQAEEEVLGLGAIERAEALEPVVRRKEIPDFAQVIEGQSLGGLGSGLHAREANRSEEPGQPLNFRRYGSRISFCCEDCPPGPSRRAKYTPAGAT